MTIIETLKQEFPNAIKDSHCDYGDETIFIDANHIPEVFNFLKANPACPFNLLLDICGVDYQGQDPRFEVVYHLYSVPSKARLRVRVKVPESNLQVPSVIQIWEAADWFEREAFDMFGLDFKGHPNLKRLLMWEEFKGHPLRKDYPLNKRQPIPKPADLL